MAKNEYDLTFKKFSELDAGSEAAVVGDKIIISDVSKGGKVVTRTIQDLDNLISSPLKTTKTEYVEVTLDELKADKTLIEGVSGYHIVVNDILVRVDGNFGDLTSADIQSTAGTPQAIFKTAQAQMTDDAILYRGQAGVTLDADGFGVPLAAGDGVEIINEGTDATGGTKLQISISYVLIEE